MDSVFDDIRKNPISKCGKVPTWFQPANIDIIINELRGHQKREMLEKRFLPELFSSSVALFPTPLVQAGGHTQYPGKYK